jgi:hypothetical protein
VSSASWLQTPNVYPVDVDIYLYPVRSSDISPLPSERIRPDGTELSSNSKYEVCVFLQYGDLNKVNVSGGVAGYRVVYNGNVGNFVTLFNKQKETNWIGGCAPIEFTELGDYELWGFACTTDYACADGEGWESSPPISFTIISSN